ncbi:efflux RND transporter periplasmic adaptor subunit [Thalassoroseus pseudoceratinae]|uniref:efflux RND transporter periplasmic adaptor subunit n=1 Tax=Thalassoroseus pseudoceratinae TaxID=2713176 RepID=UPI001420E167|nr:hypothetical protein [Thalassoroseus pseudoceratinae]
MKTILRILKPVLVLALFAAVGIAGYMTRDRWLPFLQHKQSEVTETTPSKAAKESETQTKIVLSDQAIDNLGLTAKSVKPQTYWKSIQVPGMVIDRPGRSDLGVVSPVDGVVSQINNFPGDTVQAGDVLYTIRLLSETLHRTQSDLFKATQDIELAEATRKRLKSASNALPESRIIEVDNQITRLQVSVRAYRQELATRGLTPDQIDQVAQGEFVREIDVVVPSQPSESNPPKPQPIIQTAADETELRPVATFEVEECEVELGHRVEAGQVLCLLANHQLLSVEGRAFRDETQLLERSAKEGWPVDIDFQENEAADWPPIEQIFPIRYIANNIDPVNRTFGFRMPLKNESRVVQHEDGVQLLWRFRPGQKVRILVRVERLDDVFVLPSDAVTRDLAEAFVFTQNVNTFERKPVRILAEDRLHTVIANDGSVIPGTYVVQNGAAQLNRMTKSRTGNDLPEGYHIHADGSLHKNESED